MTIKSGAPAASSAQVIVGSTDGGVFKSTDGGRSWNKLAGGLPTTEPSSVAPLNTRNAAPHTYSASEAGFCSKGDGVDIFIACDEANTGSSHYACVHGR